MSFDRASRAGLASVTVGDHLYDQLAVKGNQAYLMSPGGRVVVFDMPDGMDTSPRGLKDFLKNDVGDLMNDPSIPRIEIDIPDTIDVDDFAVTLANGWTAAVIWAKLCPALR